jgi:hypothetical protein
MQQFVVTSALIGGWAVRIVYVGTEAPDACYNPPRRKPHTPPTFTIAYTAYPVHST